MFWASFTLILLQWSAFFQAGLGKPLPQIYVPGSPAPVVKTYIHLFDTGGPHQRDIDQTTVPDCWLAATMCMLAKVNQKNIRNIFYDTIGGSPADPTVYGVTVKLFEPDTFKRIDQKVILADTVGGNDNANFQVWWPSAIQAAIKKNGGQGIKDGQFEGSYGHVALDYLTGKNGVFQFKDNNTFDLMVKYADITPMILGSNADATSLVAGHAYGIEHAWVDNKGDKIVRLRNPWGDTKDYKYKEIESSINHISHLENWDNLQ